MTTSILFEFSQTPNLPEPALNPHSKSSFTNGIDDRVAQKTGHEYTSGDVSSVSPSSSERMSRVGITGSNCRNPPRV